MTSFAKDGELFAAWREQPDLPGARIAEDFAGQRREAERVRGDVKRKVGDSEVLDRPDLGQPSLRARPASAAPSACARPPTSRLTFDGSGLFGTFEALGADAATKIV